MLKPLYTHFTEKECFNLLSRIIDEKLSVRDIKAELSAYSQNKIQRRLLQSPKEKNEVLEVIEGLDLLDERTFNEPIKKTDSGLSVFKKPSRKLKFHNENRKLIGFQDEFWESLLKLIEKKLKVMINKVIPFKKGFEQLIACHS